MSYLVQSHKAHRSVSIFFSTSPWISLCMASVCSDAQDIYKLYLAAIPNSFLCAGQIVRSSPHSSNNPTRAKHNLPSSSTPSREVLRQPYKCSLVLLEQFLTIKIDLPLLFRAERLHSFLEYCWKEQTHLKSRILTKCLLVWLCMKSVGIVLSVWCVSRNPGGGGGVPP